MKYLAVLPQSLYSFLPYKSLQGTGYPDNTELSDTIKINVYFPISVSFCLKTFFPHSLPGKLSLTLQDQA